MATRDLVQLTEQRLADAIRALIVWHGMTQAELGDELGYSKSAIGARLNPPAGHLSSADVAMVARLFGVPVGVLYEGRQATLRFLIERDDEPEIVIGPDAATGDTVGRLVHLDGGVATMTPAEDAPSPSIPKVGYWRDLPASVAA